MQPIGISFLLYRQIASFEKDLKDLRKLHILDGSRRSQIFILARWQKMIQINIEPQSIDPRALVDNR